MGKTGEMVDDEGMYSAMKDWARSVEIDSPEQYFIDPASRAAQEVKQQKAQAAQAEQQAQMQQQQQVLALQMQVAQANLSSEQMQKLWELQFKYFDAVLKSEVEEAKLIGDAIQTQLNEMQAIGNARSTTVGAGNNGVG